MKKLGRVIMFGLLLAAAGLLVKFSQELAHCEQMIADCKKKKCLKTCVLMNIVMDFVYSKLLSWFVSFWIIFSIMFSVK